MLWKFPHPGLAKTMGIPTDSNRKPTKGSRPLRGLLILSFQDHSVLETISVFRIILGLENADGRAFTPLTERILVVTRAVETPTAPDISHPFAAPATFENIETPKSIAVPNNSCEGLDCRLAKFNNKSIGAYSYLSYSLL